MLKQNIVLLSGCEPWLMFARMSSTEVVMVFKGMYGWEYQTNMTSIPSE